MLKPSLPRTLADGEVLLREIEPRDAPLLYLLRMDPSSRPLFRNTDPVSYERHQAFVDRYFQEPAADCWFVIEAAGEPVGTVSLYAFTAGGTRCASGRLAVAPEVRGRGYGRRGMRLLLAYARLLGVEEVDAEVVDTNAPWIAVLESLGYARRGVVQDPDGRTFVELRLAFAGEAA